MTEELVDYQFDELAVVIYTSENDTWQSRFLNKEINHCMLGIADAGRWIICDPCTDKLNLYTVEKLPTGCYYQRVRLKNSPKLFVFSSCVSFIKKFIGVTNPFVITPYQLYNHIKRLKNGQKS